MSAKSAPHSRLLGWAVALVAIGLLTGCAASSARSVAEATPVVFPAPPAPARVQYLGGISTPDDLPRARSKFADFVLGPEPTSYPLAKPISATLQGSRLYVCDTVLNSVLVYDLVSGEARPLEGDRGIGKIRQPNNLCFDSAGRLYVADKVRQAVVVYNPDESFLAAWGRPGEFAPVAVAVHGDEIFVCDSNRHEIEVWSRQDGSRLRTIGGLGNEPGKFFIPTQVAVDAGGVLHVTDTGNFRVQRLTRTGEPLAVVGGPGRALGKFAWPKGMDLDGRGRLYVADSRFANVQIFDAQGRLLLFFGGPGPDGGHLDLPAGVRLVPWPRGVPWLEQRLMAGFDPEFLAVVVSQQAQYFVNFFAIAREEASP
ncbi:MAG: hypothetical protein KF858_00295 [Candidatus Sumerlaeia bacterium]|nr:hypothetical protein [Candidatus Sumerlaeia bacterium]